MNIETLQAAERVSAWYRNRRVVTAAHTAALTPTHTIPSADAHAANDGPLPKTPAVALAQGCSSDVSSVGAAALLRNAHSTPATSKATPASVSL